MINGTLLPFNAAEGRREGSRCHQQVENEVVTLALFVFFIVVVVLVTAGMMDY